MSTTKYQRQSHPALLGQWDWYRTAPKSLRHRGVAFYDAQRLRGPLPLITHPREFAGYDSPPSFLKIPKSWGKWEPAESFHTEWHFKRTRESLPADATQMSLNFDDAQFTFANSVVAAKLIPAIERIRAGRLLAKDLPKHFNAPRKSFRWWQPDAQGFRQLTFADMGVRAR